MQLPNVVEVSKWMVEYDTPQGYFTDIFEFVDKWMTRAEMYAWFEKNYEWKPTKCLCIGESRIRK